MYRSALAAVHGSGCSGYGSPGYFSSRSRIQSHEVDALESHRLALMIPDSLPYAVVRSLNGHPNSLADIRVFTIARASSIQCHTCIQDFVPVRIGDDAIIFKYLKIHALKYPVLVRTNQYELPGFW